MADEKKVETETTEKKTDEKGETETPEEKKTDETEETDEEPEESEEGKKEPSQDWKKIAQEEREAREKAERALASDRYKSRHKKDETDDADEEESEEEKPGLTEEQLRKILREERDATRKEVLAGRTKEIARELAESDDEADAIVEIFNNRSFPETLTHEQKVREAFFIAHGPRLTAKILELRRSLKSKDTKGRSGNENTYRDAPKGSEPKLSGADKESLKSAGFTWDGKRYTKKLPGGKIMVKSSLKDKPQILDA